MKLAIFLFLSMTANAFAAPSNLVCIENSYTSVCDTMLPMPCPGPPPLPAIPLVRVKLDVSSDNKYVAGKASASTDVNFEGVKFGVFVTGAFSMNADGSDYSPTITLRLTDKVSGWSTESTSAPERATVTMNVTKSVNLNNRGKISTAHGFVLCTLE
ncbi:MAG: hypothetical protein ACXWR1_10155 [Bdellovibrionota bacterium]